MKGFTKTEKEVLKLLMSGYSNQKIADLLFISEPTVRAHLHNIYEKSGIDKDPDINQRVLLVQNIMKRMKK